MFSTAIEDCILPSTTDSRNVNPLQRPNAVADKRESPAPATSTGEALKAGKVNLLLLSFSKTIKPSSANFKTQNLASVILIIFFPITSRLDSQSSVVNLASFSVGNTA